MNDYIGPERRTNSMNGREIVTEIKIDLTKLETRFEERWKSHDSQADDKQKATCQKLDEIKTDITELKEDFVDLDKKTVLVANIVSDKVTKLPCDTRLGWYKSMGRQVAFMWVVLSGMCLTLFLIVIKAFAR